MTYVGNIQYPKETHDLLDIEVSYSGARITNDVEFGLLASGVDRGEIEWKPSTTIGDTRFGLMLDGTLPAGKYEVWARVTQADPVREVWVECGTITLY